LAFAIAACSGGTAEGPLTGPGPSPDEPPEGDERSSENPFNIGGPTQNQGGFGTGGNGQGGGDGGCVTCAGFLAGQFDPNQSMICESSALVASDIFMCACDTCLDDCGSLCSDLEHTNACTNCMTQSCSSEFAACQAN